MATENYKTQENFYTPGTMMENIVFEIVEIKTSKFLNLNRSIYNISYMYHLLLRYYNSCLIN